MKTILLASTFTVAISGAAVAADAIAYEATPEIAAAVGYDWTGLYVGADLGYAWANTNVTALDDYLFSPALDDEFDFRSDDIIGSVHAGYNWQRGRFVYGVEVDITASGIDETVDNTLSPGSGESFSTNIDWFGTARARLGYAVDRFLPYVTGGIAFADIESRYNDPEENFPFPVGNFAAASDVVFGWTLGGGAEYALDENWILRAEYLYVDLEDSRGTLQTIFSDTYRYDFDNDLHVVRIGASYKF